MPIRGVDPTTDIERSAAFYRDVFGWRLRKRGDGVTAFDDPTGEMSGSGDGSG
jgi:uncharacterized protein